jgi:hypothetical protein
MLKRLARFCEVELITYCVMSNHFHVLVHVPARREPKSVSDDTLLVKLRQFYGKKGVCGREVGEASGEVRGEADERGATDPRGAASRDCCVAGSANRCDWVEGEASRGTRSARRSLSNEVDRRATRLECPQSCRQGGRNNRHVAAKALRHCAPTSTAGIR